MLNFDFGRGNKILKEELSNHQNGRSRLDFRQIQIFAYWNDST